MAIVKANKSSSLRVTTAPVDFTRSPDGQEDAILAGLRQCERLRQFFVEHDLGPRLRATLGAEGREGFRLARLRGPDRIRSDGRSLREGSDCAGGTARTLAG
jgi:hypothetical protein